MADSSSVKVAVRVRPLVPSELAKGCLDILDVVQENEQIIIKRTDTDNMFTFNYVMPTDSTQSELYNRCIQPLIGNLFKGYNVTIFAYGQTGSGKTHTMGTAYNGEDEEGVIPRAVTEIFNHKKDNFCYNFNITVSFMELYQEVLYDLLSDKEREQTTLDIREDPKRGIYIPGLVEIPVNSVLELLETLRRGSQSRITGATAMNATSSRSHAIFVVNIYMGHKTDSRENKQAKLNLVDLAGSERPKKTGAVGNTFKEGVNINKGLFVLGNVISALGDEKQQKGFVPYRDSNLTRLLKDSLGGNSITLMIACVSPADYNLDETLSTLRYADRARKIKNKPVVNQDAKVAEINELKKVIQQLRLQIVGQGGPVICQAEIELLQKEILDMKGKLKEMTLKLSQALMDNTCLHERIVLLQSINETLNKKIASLKQQCDETFHNIDEGLSNNDTILVKDNVSKLRQIYIDFVQIDQEQRETEEEIKYQEKIFNDNLLNPKNSSLEQQDTTGELEQQQVNHANRQMELNEQLKEIHKQLALKEGLAKSLAMNNRTMVDINDLNENHEKIASLEKEKEELLQKLKNVGNNTGSSDLHRKRIQELENQLIMLNKKVKEQARLIEHKAKSEEKMKQLDREILQMKQAKVKLIRAMREESDKFRQWRLHKEKECIRLKQQERKKDNEIVKMKIMHSKQQTVFKRRVEQAEALNKRLKNALALRKQVTDNKKTGQADKIEPWLKQEYDLFINTVAADSTLKLLLNDRAVLKQQLDEMKAEPDKATEEAIKSVEEDIELRSVQIQDLQTKILDADEENRAKIRFDKVQSMSEAKYALKFLFSQIEKQEQEKVQIEAKLNDLQDTNKEYAEKLKLLEEKYQTLEQTSNDRFVEQQKEYEDHIALLLNNDERALAAANEDDGVLSRLVNLQQQLESQRKLNADLEEEISKLRQPKIRSKHHTVNFPEEPATLPLLDSPIVDPDDITNDPDWRKTPLGKRVMEVKRRRKDSALLSSSLAEKPGKTGGGCSCKTICSKRCGCRRMSRQCGEACKCSVDLCPNRDTENVEPSTSNSDSLDDNLMAEGDIIPTKRKKKSTRLFTTIDENGDS